jgi:hypothetical protein
VGEGMGGILGGGAVGSKQATAKSRSPVAVNASTVGADFRNISIRFTWRIDRRMSIGED